MAAMISRTRAVALCLGRLWPRAVSRVKCNTRVKGDGVPLREPSGAIYLGLREAVNAVSAPSQSVAGDAFSRFGHAGCRFQRTRALLPARRGASSEPRRRFRRIQTLLPSNPKQSPSPPRPTPRVGDAPAVECVATSGDKPARPRLRRIWRNVRMRRKELP